MNPLVTVLMPVYNAEAFLREAIDSILQQTLTKFEFLIIDDGSTDSSVSIIKSYTDPRIHFIQNEKNLGISASLNRGIELAACELIARMDADDISYPERLQKQYDYFQTNKDVALLSTWAREISETGEPVYTARWRRPFFYYNLTFECWVYHPTVMYRRSAVLDVGAYSTPYSEDYDLWWHLSRTYKIDNLTEVLVDYRLTTESLYRATKKTEYEEAQYNQIMRNIHYFTGPTFSITHPEVECYRHNFSPILNEKSIEALVKAVHKLDAINQCILQKDNINRDVEAVREAAFEKKKFIINQLTGALPNRKKLRFLVRLGQWRKLFGTVRKALPV
jgi:glycosyltransferase involved in cell wall biosynthesis